MTSPSTFDLDALVREAIGIDLRQRRGAGSVKRLRLIDQIVRSSYADPANWKPNRFVHLLHNDPEVGSLGFFQEFFHKSGARKLVSCPEPALYEIEIVDGGEWRGPQTTPPIDPPTEGEVAHIRNSWQDRTWRPSWKHLQRAARGKPKIGADALLKRLFETDTSAPSAGDQSVCANRGSAT
jgi:hypothetical protein